MPEQTPTSRNISRSCSVRVCNRCISTLAKISANADALSQVLRYHALATEIIATDSLTDGKVITSAEGSTITVNNKDGVITLTTDSGQTVNVVLTGIKASNGIIHLIDTVMIPKDLVLG